MATNDARSSTSHRVVRSARAFRSRGGIEPEVAPDETAAADHSVERAIAYCSSFDQVHTGLYAIFDVIGLGRGSHHVDASRGNYQGE